MAARDAQLGIIISSQRTKWSFHSSGDPIWGLIRIVMAQQVSTKIACRLAEQAKSMHPYLEKPSPAAVPEVASLRALGMTERRAQCCIAIVENSIDIRRSVRQGKTWEEALAGIKGIGPWTLAVFRIMVLRDPDVLALGDVGLNRAIANIYGPAGDVQGLAEAWRPFRSVACWYLWRTLGNEQLG